MLSLYNNQTSESPINVTRVFQIKIHQHAPSSWYSFKCLWIDGDYHLAHESQGLCLFIDG